MEEKYRALKASTFKQQTLPAFRPSPTFFSTQVSFLTFFIILLSIGVHLFSESAKIKEENRNTNSPPENLLNLINNPSSIPINIPTSTLLPFLGLNNHSKYSLKHPDYLLPNSSVI